MDSLSDHGNAVEIEFLRILADLLRTGSIDLEQGKDITRRFLALTPFTTSEDLQSKIKQFINEHKEFEKIYLTLLNYKEEKKTQALLERMREHLKENRIDEAIALVKT